MSRSEAPGLARRLASNTMHAAGGRLAALLLWLLLTPPLYRELGTEGFAVWSLFYALTGYLGALDMGLANATLRQVSASRARNDDRAAGGFATVSVSGYVVLGVVWLALLPLVREPVLEFLRVPPAVQPAAHLAFLMGAIVFVLIGVTNTMVAVLQGYERFDLGNLTTLTVSIAQAAGMALCLLRHGGLPGVVYATAFGWGCAVIVGLGALRSGAPGFRWASPRGALARVRESLRFGAPLQLANLLAVAHQQLDKLLLARFVSLAAVAPYELGLRIATSATTFPQILMLALVPAATALHTTGDRERLWELYLRSNRYLLFASVALSAGVVAGAPSLFHAWLGHPEPQATLALRGLMLAACAGMAGGMATVTARGAGRTDLEAEFSGAALVAHLALGLWLVPTSGLLGAVVALAAGNVVGVAWFLARLARSESWPLARMLSEPLLWPGASLIAGVTAAWVLQRAFPEGGGLLAWTAAITLGGAATAVSAGVMLGGGFVRWGEVVRLARLRGA